MIEVVLVEVDKTTLSYIKELQQKDALIKEAKQEVDKILNDMKALSTEKFKEAYGNPTKCFAEAQFKLVLAKKGMTFEEYQTQMRQNAARRKSNNKGNK